MANQYETVYKGDIYVAELTDSVYGGCDLVVRKIRQGRSPKPHFTRHYQSRFDALVGMENCLRDANWREK